ncbi:MAG TPA: S-methyl-5-thioribose-1-phosphate isomerase [Anaerolineae bacterium]|nr:S-methyl-5-thioribose-1-phosphate isomerase [Anaerolineae bacterium]
MRTLEWDYQYKRLKIIDQRVLPSQFEILTLDNYKAVAEAIRSMAVRGAPAIGVAAAFGMALAAQASSASTVEHLRKNLQVAAQLLGKSRPTAINLSWALKRMLAIANKPVEGVLELKERILMAAQQMADEDVATNRVIAKYGAELIADGDMIIHHCNTGALATVDWGTALGIIRLAHEQGKRVHVLVDETRPLLQGARLTAWELQQLGIPYDIISDNAAGYFLSSGKVHKVLFGADRVARNGDVANKIGTYMLALAAKDNDVPAYSVFPTSTVDLSLPSGKEIPIEERDAEEVLALQLRGKAVAPQAASARNPAFDITPHHLITAFITEKGIIVPPYEKNLAEKVAAQR